MQNGIKAVMVVGLVLLWFNSGVDRVQAQVDGQVGGDGTTVRSRFGGEYDVQLANQDSWIEELSVVQARDYGADLVVSGAVVTTIGSVMAWTVSGAFGSGIANYEPGSVAVSPTAYVGIGAASAIGIFGISLIVAGAINIAIADQVLIGDDR